MESKQGDPSNNTSAAATPSAGVSANQEKARKEKDLGNEAFQAGDFAKAIEHFSNAIELDPYNHVLFRYPCHESMRIF